MRKITSTFVLYLFLLISTFSACHSNSDTEKYQNKRTRIVNIKEKIIELNSDSVYIGSIARLYISKDYLIISDSQSTDKLIHLFDKKNYAYLTSIVNKGQGPAEVVNIGCLGIDDNHNKLFISDHGKQKIFTYDLDSIYSDFPYPLKTKMDMNKSQFPDQYRYFTDTLCVGLIVEPIGHNNFTQYIGKWNMTTGEIDPMPYVHPKTKIKRIKFDASKEKNICVEVNHHYDLMTICTIDGDLVCNVYGPEWDSSSHNKKMYYYGGVKICGDKIIASYSGKDNVSDERYPTKFHVFELNGNYIKTLDVGYKISNFCYDPSTNRLIINFNDVIQFGYLNLNDMF